MNYKKLENTIAVRLEIDEEIIGCVKEICRRENIKSAVIHGIGAVKSTRIAMFDFDKGEYKENEINKFMELISLEGNVTQMEGEAYIHLHAVFGDESGKAYGGHLKEAVIGATCEMFIFPLCSEIKRFHDEKTGLNLFDIRGME